MEEIQKIKDRLYEKYRNRAQRELVDTSILYMQKKLAEKRKKSNTGRYEYAYNLQPDFILQTIAEVVDNGFAFDGVNYVLTGNRMYMPTYHAFKNKIYRVYPETVIDLQLIREGDIYNFAKESGVIVYQHTIADPFEATEHRIIGAYCVIENNRGQFLETLNARDYQKMRESSKNPKLWTYWASEFWLKSVIKRACKRHFHDITATIEAKDNEVIGLDEIVKASPDKKAAIIKAKKEQDEDTKT